MGFEHKAIGADIDVDLIGFKTVKAQVHQTNIKEIVAMNADCVVISFGLHVDQTFACEHITKTTANC